MGTIRIGVDIGGTFTDLLFLDEKTGNSFVIKVPSQPKDPSGALVDAVTRAIKKGGVKSEQVKLLNHGSTIVTNAVLEHKLARTALVATAGFGDVLEIGRHLRPDMYDLNQDKPDPIVPRDLRFEVNERMAANGSVVVELDKASLERAIGDIRDSGAQAVAVSFLHSYANADHEQAVRDAIKTALPKVSVVASADVCREIREYERTSTVALNAAAMPVVSEYLEVLEERIAEVTPEARVLLMQSNGGAMTVDAARKMPVQLIYSGPAGGVLACQSVGRLTERPNVLGFDMGGTSTDISVVFNNEPIMTNEADVGGNPVKLPVLDINTIGAGGGSIAWIDAGGALRVGPHSAGADPGPVAYGRGGTDPTVTDANLVLGRFSPDRFLGGELPLDKDAALAAIKEKIADPLGLDPIVAAAGILRVANANMERALKVSSVERGYDPRDFTLIAFGGGGPVHSAALMREVGFADMLVPSAAGVFSAFGLLISDIRHDDVRSYITSTTEASLETLNALFAEMESVGQAQLEGDRIAADHRDLQRTADLRYVGQAYEVNVPAPSGKIDGAWIDTVVANFHQEHQRQFAHSAEKDPVEIVNLRLVSMGRVDPLKLRKPEASGKADAKPSGHRQVYFEELGDFAKCPVFERDSIDIGATIDGPAIIEQLDCTTVVHPGQILTVDDWGNLIVKIGE